VNAGDLLRQVEERPRFEVEVGLLLDSVAFAEARALNDKLERLRWLPDGGDITDGTVTDTAARLVELYEQTPEQRFVLQARTVAEWEAIVSDTEGDLTERLFAACCVEPEGWTVADVKRLKDSLTIGQWTVLTTALRQVNEGLFDLRPTRAATALTSGMRQRSTTALPEE